MSEAEKKRRLDYKENRKKWMMIQTVFIIALALIAAVSFIVHHNLNKNYYIEYTEQGNVTWTALLMENDFYEGQIGAGDKAYVSELIDDIMADFKYQLNIDDEVSFNYSYSISSQLFIIDQESGTAIYNPTEIILPKQECSQQGKSLSINTSLAVDYDKYNKIANDFIETYDLRFAESKLVLTMEVDVISNCANFENNSNRNTYTISLNMPLASATSNITTSSSVPNGESKTLACGSLVGQIIAKAFGIVATTLCVFAGAFLIAFAYLTRNDDINYEIKVKRTVSRYRSFIQVLTNHFDTDGYKILMIGTFNEMLSIRDTIQSPILLDENDDKTCAHFIIVTDDKTVYMHEIKVENFEELYAEEAAIEEIQFEEEPIIVAENVDEEALEEALEAPDIILEEVEYVEPVEEEDDDGVEVIGVVWPEHAHRNKVYRYDPDGTTVHDGDIVLVPSHDKHKHKDIIRKAAVAHGNHKVAPESIKHPLKKIIGIVKRKAEMALTPDIPEEENSDNE